MDAGFRRWLPRAVAVAVELVGGPTGDGRADDMDEVEKEDGDTEWPLLFVVVGVGKSWTVPDDGRMQEANAAKWRGKHPCRDSLIPAASG